MLNLILAILSSALRINNCRFQPRQPARSQPCPLRTDLKPSFRPQNRAFLWTNWPKPAFYPQNTPFLWTNLLKPGKNVTFAHKKPSR